MAAHGRYKSSDPKIRAVCDAVTKAENHWYGIVDEAERVRSEEHIGPFMEKQMKLTIEIGEKILEALPELPDTTEELDRAAWAMHEIKVLDTQWENNRDAALWNRDLSESDRLKVIDGWTEHKSSIGEIKEGAQKAYDHAYDDLFKQRRDMLVSVLSQTPHWAPATLKLDPRSDPSIQPYLDEVLSVFPDAYTSWPVKIGIPPLMIIGGKGVGAYDPSKEIAAWQDFSIPLKYAEDVPPVLHSMVTVNDSGKIRFVDTPENREMLLTLNEKLYSDALGARHELPVPRDGAQMYTEVEVTEKGSLRLHGLREGVFKGPLIRGIRKDHTLAHELCHYIEDDNAYIGELSRTWRASRSSDKIVTSRVVTDSERALMESEHNSDILEGDPREIKGKFVTPYIGMVYEGGKRTGATEVFTVGVQSSFFGKQGGLIGLEGKQEDREYLAFTLGILASPVALGYKGYEDLFRSAKPRNKWEI